MGIRFHKVVKGVSLPRKWCAHLRVNNWDDYSYKTLFYLVVYDSDGKEYEIGNLKIGYVGQQHGWTEAALDKDFEYLPAQFFSLGQDVEYYENLKKYLPPDLGEYILSALCDIAYDEKLFAIAKGEQVYLDSLARGVSQSAINVQYKRVIAGGVVLTPFDFGYVRERTNSIGEINLSFKITPGSKPPSNMHVLIGRNGVGKTTLLNGMVRAIIEGAGSEDGGGQFHDNEPWSGGGLIDEDYFSSVVSVSFSAFDPFIPPPDRVNRSEGPCYYYIGLKIIDFNKGGESYSLKTMDVLCVEFVDSLMKCFSLESKKLQWLKAIYRLESDVNFESMDLPSLCEYAGDSKLKARASYLFSNMSSGHALVLITVTRLVETVEEKTLILLDEPESHLHPPLLSAFTRAMTDLLIDRNGVAIVATHSPVVLQEVPKSCVWKVRRANLETNAERPESETFAENVGVLTREVFGLEVSRSGFHALLAQSVLEGKSYDEIVHDYTGQLGFEGRALLRALINNRELEVE